MTTATETESFRGTSKRERILRAAVDVFAEFGYFNAKVAQIAKSAGVADGTIYLYFDGKEDLLITIFREHTRNYLRSLEQSLANKRLSAWLSKMRMPWPGRRTSTEGAAN